MGTLGSRLVQLKPYDPESKGIVDPAHDAIAAVLRRQFQSGPPPVVGDHLVRDLTDYDRAFGLDFASSAVTSDGEVA